MRGYVDVRDNLQAETSAEAARDIRAIAETLHAMAEQLEDGTREPRPGQLYLAGDALFTIAEAVDRVGGDA